MASSSSHQIFTSFHGPDVRKTFLSHLRQQFEHNGITMFDDNEMERSQLIAPTLTQAIRQSRISIVLLSKNYASSGWCLDELLEILKCKEEAGQIVMTIFYGVDPSDVQKQIGDFGIAFNETCVHKTDEDKRKWIQALTYVANIAGEDFKDCKNEAKMIEKIAKDVFSKLNVTPSKDFEDMVGLDTHLKEIESMLELGSDRVKIVGISGPAGIGKSTIVRALHSQLSSSFPLSCFMDNLRGHYHNGSDEYTSKLGLQGQLLSEILNQNCMNTGHLDMVKYWLHDKKVLIILDDVASLDQLEALANIGWFGPGSRVLVTTENKEILKNHGITDIYHVGFPSKSEALKIFCLYAFGHPYPPCGFKNLAHQVVSICGNLPLGLKVLGSSLRGKSEDKWKDELPRLKTCLDRRIESVLKVGYESLDEKDQDLFLFVAVFFNYRDVDHVTSMLAKTNMDVGLGLENLANRCLIDSEDSKLVMHRLLQVIATQVISKQEPWKRQILANAQQICYVLENGKGNGSILGISFDTSKISNELKLSEKAFEKMYNLLFLEVYNNGWNSQEVKLHIPEEMKFLPSLRSLRWDAYPGKTLPLKFCPENLIALDMSDSLLEKLWEGTQPLWNLKKMNLSYSSRLKELPDLSNATSLEKLDLTNCSALVELPSSISNLDKLVHLWMQGCKSLEIIPNLANLTSLGMIDMGECPRLRIFPALIWHCSRVEIVDLRGSRNLKAFVAHLPWSITALHLERSGIERITDCIKDLPRLETLDIASCKRLMSLPELPCSLKYLHADSCESLERISGPLNTPHAKLEFTNCFKLDGQSRLAIIQSSFVTRRALLPGREVPAEFLYRARGNYLTIPHSDFTRLKVCVVLSLDKADFDEDTDVDNENQFKSTKPLCRWNEDIYIPRFYSRTQGFITEGLSSEHLLIFEHRLSFIDPSQARKERVLKFSSLYLEYFNIIECGIQILRDKTEGSNNGEDDGMYKYESHKASDEEEEKSSDEEDYESETGESSHRKDDEENYNSESREASDDEYEGIANKSVSRKRRRKTRVNTNLTLGNHKRRSHKSKSSEKNSYELILFVTLPLLIFSYILDFIVNIYHKFEF